jgi:hypothetical protein
VSLATPPQPPQLLASGLPFLLTAWWWTWDQTGAERRERPGVVIAAAEYPGAHSHEFAIGRPLCVPIEQVELYELPIALQLVRRGSEWAFDYLGGPELFSSPAPPTLRTPEQIRGAEEAMLRESLGIPPDQPIPEPQGPLPAEDRPEQPYRFDPTPHMDLSTAEAPAPLPPPAPPGPPPAEQSRLPAPVPPPGKPLGAFGDASQPFAH